jgi:hypothetical protein
MGLSSGERRETHTLVGSLRKSYLPSLSFLSPGEEIISVSETYFLVI